MTAPRIWILVADGQTARLEPALPYEMRMPNPPTREQGAERPGRAYESSGKARHAVEPHVDWHREAKRSFAGELADLLGQKARDNAFDELVLIAPPQMMGDLRDALDGATKARVKTEVTKDLTQLTAIELHDYLTEEVWF